MSTGDPAQTSVSVVVPNWNGRHWLSGCLESIAAQQLAPLEVIVVDNGSTDGSVGYLRAEHPEVVIIELADNTGFAHAANRGIAAARGEFIALLNSDVVLERDWTSRTLSAIGADSEVGAVACKMLSLESPNEVYDAGDALRRDGLCDQRGRFQPDDGRWDISGEVFGACAGAALYRGSALREVGGFDERYFAYLEDVDLALRLQLAGWRCRYEPAVALHAGEGSSHQLSDGARYYVSRNTLLLVAKWFPLRWLPYVVYRQAGYGWHALRDGHLGTHLRGLRAAVRMLPGALRGRRAQLRAARVPIAIVVPPHPIRGARARIE